VAWACERVHGVRVRRVVIVVALASVCVLAQTATADPKTKPPLPCKFKGAKIYPGDSAPKSELAKWLAEGALKAGLPVELPVMGALVESNLTNVVYGDSDAAGFFQTRVSIWNTGPYAGFPDHPNLQLQWFVDQALVIERIRLAEGIPLDELLNDDSRYGEWVADVLQPAEQYRDRYQLRLADARALICA
jgi:hypothetical protein